MQKLYKLDKIMQNYAKLLKNYIKNLHVYKKDESKSKCNPFKRPHQI